MTLRDFIAAEVKSKVADSILDRDALERESAIRVFDRAFGWMKLFAGAAAFVLAIGTGLGIWKAIDFFSAVKDAEQNVSEAAGKAKIEMEQTSKDAVKGSRDASNKAIEANDESSRRAQELSRQLGDKAKTAGLEIAAEGASVTKEVNVSREVLQDVQKLKPEFEEMRSQLTTATQAVEAERKELSSTENFAKSIFSSHQTEYFLFEEFEQPRAVVILPSKPEMKMTTIYMLLAQTPIDNTLQLQFGLFAQPPNSYFKLTHNLIAFLWGSPSTQLQQQGTMLSVAYFPDPDDSEKISKLSVHDGRVWADDQPLPKLSQPDPDFKGNKWMPLVDPTGKPVGH